MNPVKIAGETRSIGKPHNWEDATHGQCGALSVRDGVSVGLRTMASAWRPSEIELELLKAGHPLLLTIYGETHPVVSLGVGTTADLAE